MPTFSVSDPDPHASRLPDPDPHIRIQEAKVKKYFELNWKVSHVSVFTVGRSNFVYKKSKN